MPEGVEIGWQGEPPPEYEDIHNEDTIKYRFIMTWVDHIHKEPGSRSKVVKGNKAQMVWIGVTQNRDWCSNQNWGTIVSIADHWNGRSVVGKRREYIYCRVHCGDLIRAGRAGHICSESLYLEINNGVLSNEPSCRWSRERHDQSISEAPTLSGHRSISTDYVVLESATGYSILDRQNSPSRHHRWWKLSSPCNSLCNLSLLPCL